MINTIFGDEPLELEDFITAIKISQRRYHIRNIHKLFENLDITSIVVIKDCNVNSTFWRYFWMESNIIFLYTGRLFIDGIACISDIYDKQIVSFNGRQFIASKINNFQYKFARVVK